MNKLQLLSKLPEGMTQKASRALLVAQKHSPQAMFAVGVVGVGVTVVVAARATLKLDSVLLGIQETQDQIEQARVSTALDDKSAKRFKTLAVGRGALHVAKLYTPAFVCGVGSIALLTGSHVVLTNRNAGLGAALVATERAFDSYRARVTEELGEDKDLEFRHGTEDVQEKVIKDGKTKTKTRKQIAGDPSMYARDFDETCRNYTQFPNDNLFYIKCQQNTANDMLRVNGHIFLNEVYDLLGMDRSPAGAVVGWVTDGKGDGFVDFGLFTGDENDIIRDFLNGRKNSIRLDFNVDGVVYDLI